MQFSNYSKEVIRMSKSYKKYTCFTDNQRSGAKKEKRFANKKVRKTFDINDGCAYKKLYCSWNIHDYKFAYYSKHEVEGATSSWWHIIEPLYDEREKSILFPQWYKNYRGC